MQLVATEAELLKASGYKRKGLRNMRYGLENGQGGKTTHSLIEGIHWIHSPIIYTEAGVIEVMRRAKERDKRS